MGFNVDVRRAAVVNQRNFVAIRLAEGVAMCGEHAGQISRFIGAVAGYKLDHAAIVPGDEKP
jgi:hypothetical protein